MKRSSRLVKVLSVLLLSLAIINCSDDDNPISEICNNGIDDDNDGQIDCNDPDCSSNQACINQLAEICNNGIDDDNDGKIDCDDPDCSAVQDCLPEPVWEELTYFSNSIYNFEVYDDKLFIVGGFTKRENSNCYFSATYDGSDFTNHTTTVGGSGIDELTPFNNKLYGACGLSSGAGTGVCSWGGTTWNVSGPDAFNFSHSSIYTDGTTLYVGGDNSIVSYRTASSTYSQYPAVGGNFDYISEIIEYNGELIVGGSFDGLISKWNGSSWENLGGGLTKSLGNSAVRTLYIYNNELYVGGSFKKAGGQSITDIAKWNGVSWSSIGGSVTSNSGNGMRDILDYNGEIYVVGDFTEIGGVSAKYVAKWTGNEWESLNFDEDDFPNCVEIYDDKIFVGSSSFGEAYIYTLAL